MKIAKVLNNNVVIVHDEQGNEQVVMGRGLAFKKRSGDELDPTLVEKTFALKSRELTGRLSELLSEIPLEVVIASECIIALAREQLSCALHESLAIALTDHVNFALTRHQQNLPIRNVLQWEIRSLYPKEYAVGLAALDIIEKRLKARLPEDEAGFIALHLVNAQLGSEMPAVMHITKFMQEILHIVKYQLQLDYQTDSLSYNRFVTHLKFFSQRMLGKRGVYSDDESLHDVVRDRYPDAYKCVEKIDRHVMKNYEYTLGSEERMFLTIHIERVRKETLALGESQDEA
ncbi:MULTISPECIES: BglG family transcription antiterminator LicT [Erwinia]|uniref:Beta-glucoside operon transcriptional antiterminator n=1 Tax=Erwinia rhapontici TaxID=55212 RepID=A0ABM7N0D1_ERWRD|nr:MULTISPECIES: PRD domain-containing protein [Erwinia]MBP2155692.1 beta-glucoside operon transcriptional antiterminator [Erwinia rhapontici]MCS3606046.1 beta-glucoside operon transcriptional antiterminator [Erwinia rhapontici]NKG32434.1 PRD domain-containing protein [Erwinia rhapontici]NNS05827.1 PRD domain-containing protein [Erwinia sp. JH02]TDS98351.1 BglG family transcriptional antiterminator [Erwinia rhapontici]